ncbi:sigma factor-like helix-turn-helix DNA-binding protein [Moorella sulfitireducens]|uniref:sigma-70 region 4 domain-containing protein n=1 Tax=Neomoorella sulfitireducens TaxID=2972948 RepID=UPI0021AC6432
MQVEIRGVEKLSFRERQVVTLKEMGFTNEEVARRLNLSASSVATLYHRARAKGYQVVIILPGDSLNIFAGEEENG